MDRKKICANALLLTFLFFVTGSFASPSIELQRLKEAYPDTIQDVSSKYISWKDGEKLRVREASLLNKLTGLFKKEDASDESITIKDLQCDTYEPFLKKMYGGTAAEVKRNLVIIYWMPRIFGNTYPLRVTTINGIDKKIQRISDALEKLPPIYFKYLSHPAGSFYWRNVKHEKYLSAHSFGIAIDINSHYSNYWLWDWEKENRPAKPIVFRNNVPMEIVEIFEKEGFLWGGRWYFYDTMHFEYRPELLMPGAGFGLRYNNQLGTRCMA